MFDEITDSGNIVYDEVNIQKMYNLCTEIRYYLICDIYHKILM